METPLVSVIIPNYNHARFLDERIQSVLNQTYQNFEVIILDDKSTDNSVEVINKYKDNPHVSHIVVNEENSGSPFKQWYRGISMAKGGWIWIAESDDSCDNRLLERLVNGIKENVIVSFCRSTRMNSSGQSIPFNYQDCLPESLWMDGMEFISHYLGKKCVICNASSAIFKKEVAKIIPTDFQNYRACGDWLFWIYLVSKGYVTYTNEPLNYFRSHETNTTRKGAAIGLAQKEKKKIVDYLVKEKYIEIKVFMQIRKREIKKIFFGTEFIDSQNKHDLLRMWDVNVVEYFDLYLKKFYQIMFLKND